MQFLVLYGEFLVLYGEFLVLYGEFLFISRCLFWFSGNVFCTFQGASIVLNVFVFCTFLGTLACCAIHSLWLILCTL